MKKARARAEREKGARKVAPYRLRPWHYGLALAAAFAVVYVAYGPALKGPFVFDDAYLPFTEQEFINAPLAHWIRGLRPLLMFSFWVNYRLSGMETFSYHFLNLLLHFVGGILCFLMVRRLVERAGESGWKRDALAAFGGAVFLLHPLETESVSYVASRSETLSVTLFYAAFTVFLYRRREAASWPASLAVLALFAAAASTKEHTVVLPALLLLTDYWWNPGFSFSGIRRNWRLYVPLIVAAGIGLRMVWNVVRHATSAGFSVRDFTWYQYFFTQCRVIWLYIRMFFLPYGQNVDHDFAVSRTVLAHGAIVGLVALVAAAAAAWYYRRRFPLASYGFLAFLLLLAPTSSFVPIADVAVERRMYLPFFGLLLVVIEFLRRWKTGRGTVLATLAGIVLVLTYLTYLRNGVWTSAEALWADSVSKSPQKGRPRFQLGFAYFAQGRCSEALPQYEAAMKYGRGRRYDALVNWAMAYECLGRHEEAIAKLRQAAAARPNSLVYTQLGWVYSRASKSKEALEALNRALFYNPASDEAYAYRGDVYAATGDLSAAYANYRQALIINPGNETAQQGLARLGGQR
jgi:tetratricopeptide (TPR) repeat protein